MSNAVQLVVDPYLVCLPNPCTSVNQIEEFVECLLEWSSLVGRQDTEVLISDSVRIALYDDGEYPYEYRLRDLLHKFRFDVADHETICSVAQRLLASTPSLEESVGIRFVDHDEGQTHVVPRHLKARLCNHTQNAFVDMLVLWAFGRRMSPIEEGVTALASSPPSDGGQETDHVCIAAEVREADWIDVTWAAKASMPYSIDDQFMLADCYRSLRRQLGIWALWNHADDSVGAQDAIEVIIEGLIASGADGKKRREYRLGASFLSSAKQCGFGNRPDYASLLVESCARIVLAIPKNAVDEFRQSSSSRQQRVRDDGAGAFRTHLTKKGAGFRLMLWELPDGSIEFANVGNKSELVIL